MGDAGGVVYARRDGVVLREVAGEQILVPVKRNVADLKAIFALNGVGRCIWNCSTAREARTLSSPVCVERFDVSAEEASADLDAFVERLLQAGLVERRG